MQYHALSCKTMPYHAIPCNIMQYHAIPCNTMQYHAIPCNTMQYHAIPCTIMQYHAIQCNTMQYYAIQCNTMQYHASVITADGAYHCPVGSIRPFLLLLSFFLDHPPMAGRGTYGRVQHQYFNYSCDAHTVPLLINTMSSFTSQTGTTLRLWKESACR